MESISITHKDLQNNLKFFNIFGDQYEAYTLHNVMVCWSMLWVKLNGGESLSMVGLQHYCGDVLITHYILVYLGYCVTPSNGLLPHRSFVPSTRMGQHLEELGDFACAKEWGTGGTNPMRGADTQQWETSCLVNDAFGTTWRHIHCFSQSCASAPPFALVFTPVPHYEAAN
jgi:hypothetical protein